MFYGAAELAARGQTRGLWRAFELMALWDLQSSTQGVEKATIGSVSRANQQSAVQFTVELLTGRLRHQQAAVAGGTTDDTLAGLVWICRQATLIAAAPVRGMHRPYHGI